jgi:hypothetical protein
MWIFLVPALIWAASHRRKIDKELCRQRDAHEAIRRHAWEEARECLGESAFRLRPGWRISPDALSYLRAHPEQAIPPMSSVTPHLVKVKTETSLLLRGVHWVEPFVNNRRLLSEIARTPQLSDPQWVEQILIQRLQSGQVRGKALNRLEELARNRGLVHAAEIAAELRTISPNI